MVTQQQGPITVIIHTTAGAGEQLFQHYHEQQFWGGHEQWVLCGLGVTIAAALRSLATARVKARSNMVEEKRRSILRHG